MDATKAQIPIKVTPYINASYLLHYFYFHSYIQKVKVWVWYCLWSTNIFTTLPENKSYHIYQTRMIHFYFMKSTFKFHPISNYSILKVLRIVSDRCLFGANEWSGNRMLQDWGWSSGTKTMLESCYCHLTPIPQQRWRG